MSEFLGPEFTEQLSTIQACWLEAASQLVSARSADTFRQAQRMYVLTLLARVDWERTGVGEPFDHTYVAGRMNGLYNDGVRQILEDHRRIWLHPPIDLDYRTWQRYATVQIYPRIEVESGAVDPESHYDLLMLLRSGFASWREDS